MSDSLYLSRLILNPRSRRVRQELANPYELHRTVMSAFGDGCRALAERVLYRVDPMRGETALLLLVQSPVEPRWRFLEEEASARSYLAGGCGDNPAVKCFRPRFSSGQVLAFRLRANPTVRREGKRLGLAHEDAQIAWLRRKGEAGGFEPLAVQAHQEDTVTGRLHRDGTEHRLKLLSVRFDGLLRVSDPERLALAVEAGLGSGKGFGFGLLSLARASSAG